MIALRVVKTVVYYVLAAGPFLLLGVIAINSRLTRNHWDFVEYGPETTKRIEAYAGPVTVARQAVVNGRIETGESLRRALDVWLEGGPQGTLQAIPPPSTLNDGSTPIFEQILEAKQKLTMTTIRRAHQLAEKGKYLEAAHLFADVVELGQVAKYSEFSSLAEGSSYQVAALVALTDLAPSLPEEDRLALLRRLEALNSETGQMLTNMVDRFSVAYTRDLQRIGKSTDAIGAAHEQQRLASATDPIQARIEGWQRLSVSDSSVITLYGRSRAAYIHHLRYERQLEQARKALN